MSANNKEMKTTMTSEYPAVRFFRTLMFDEPKGSQLRFRRRTDDFLDEFLPVSGYRQLRNLMHEPNDGHPLPDEGWRQVASFLLSEELAQSLLGPPQDHDYPNLPFMRFLHEHYIEGKGKGEARASRDEFIAELATEMIGVRLIW